MRYLVLLLLLVGCVTPEQRAERIINRYGPLCERIGYQPDTDQWRSCILSRYDAAAQEQAARSSAAAAWYNNRPRNCTFFGNQMTCN